MSIQRKLRRGTKTESDSFTGAVAETVYDTTSNRLVNHDGSKAGGYPVPNFLDIINNAFNYVATSGTNTITGSLAYAPTAYTAGMEVVIKPANTITGAATINLNSLGAKNIYKDNGSGTLVAVASGDIKSGVPVRLTYDGTQFVAQLGGGAKVTIQVFTASGTYTPGSGMKYCVVEAVGAGGGGGRADGTSPTQYRAGGGGGGGEYVRSVLTRATVGASLAVAIGTGGTAGTTGAGGTGGDTTLGSTIVVAKGGSGGNRQQSTTMVAGGAGGTGGTGDFKSKGEQGQPGGSDGTTAPIYAPASGQGGNTVIGNGSNNGTAPPANTGVGGYGGYTSSLSNVSGSAGATGVMIITEFY